MKNRIRIRQATLDDLDNILLVEEEAWPEGLRATREQFQSRIEVFPEGILVAEVDGKIEGVMATQIMNYEVDNHVPTWYEATDNGFLRRTHNPNGDTLYGVDLSVSPFAKSGVAIALMQTGGKLAIRYNLRQVIIGGRLPRYHKFADKMSAEEYVNARTSTNRPLDPELYFYQKFGLQVIRVLPNYIRDSESANYGVLLVWKNPFYSWVKHCPFLSKVCSFFFRVK